MNCSADIEDTFGKNKRRSSAATSTVSSNTGPPTPPTPRSETVETMSCVPPDRDGLLCELLASSQETNKLLREVVESNKQLATVFKQESDKQAALLTKLLSVLGGT
eukprot:TRINITY_DN77815_c0_g1_i1.p2 TRINITY_DN77815_c0_g1~~TRINITY_DN77815_c0_g1_i1.p2  ORF type:complete len:106 (+),score=10.36 TRINITY_DN77815_c0_g1_i1:70-387(+)